MDIAERQRADEVLRQSEERFRRLVDVMPVAVYVCDTSGIIQSYNDRAVELWGRAPQWGGTAQRYCGSLRLYTPDGQLVPHQESKMAEVLRTGIEARDLEVMIERPDGSSIVALVNIVPLKNGDGELIGAMNSFQDITERKRAQEDLQHSFEQLRALAGRLQSVREEERKRVARELHDQLGQALTAIKMDVSSLKHVTKQRSESLLRLIDQTIESVRRISTELRPGILDELGLMATVEWAAEEFESRTGTTCRLDLPQAEIVIDREIATALFRILQETFTNVARHAHATHVNVRLAREDGSLTLEVHDNGKGISEEQVSAASSLGILGMQERVLLLGGELAISGAPDEGTTIHVRIPENPRARPSTVPLARHRLHGSPPHSL
jgi:signal transduction histidine kinase